MKIVLTDIFFVNWLMLHIYIVHGELYWVVNERVSGYGKNVTLFCVVDDCCKKTAGWIKFDPDYKTIFLDVRDFKHKTSRTDKYTAITNSTGFGLVIKNVREDDFNIKYLCSYGFEKSRQKVLLDSDAFKVDEQKSELPLVGIIIGSVVAVILLVAAVVLIIVIYKQKRCLRWRRQNGTRSGTIRVKKTKNNKFTKKACKSTTTIENDKLITKTVEEISTEDQMTQSERLQKIGEDIQMEIQSEVVVSRTVENSVKDNHSTESKLLQKDDGDADIEIQNESKGIATVHRVEESERKD